MRYIAFLVAIVAGVAVGLLYGWVLSPVELVDTAPSTLRIDYKADYVLMVAEAYRIEGDLNDAVARVGQLGGAPYETVVDAQRFALSVGYDPRDLAVMRDLGEAIRNWSPGQPLQGTPTP